VGTTSHLQSLGVLFSRSFMICCGIFAIILCVSILQTVLNILLLLFIAFMKLFKIMYLK